MSRATILACTAQGNIGNGFRIAEHRVLAGTVDDRAGAPAS